MNKRVASFVAGGLVALVLSVGALAAAETLGEGGISGILESYVKGDGTVEDDLYLDALNYIYMDADRDSYIASFSDDRFNIVLGATTKFDLQSTSVGYRGDINMDFLQTSGVRRARVNADTSDRLVLSWGSAPTAGLRVGSEGVQFLDPGSKPTCDSDARGSIWKEDNGAGVADTFEVCAKNSSDTYAWYSLATIP